MSEMNKYMPNWPEFAGKRYYVVQNHPKASDANAGGRELPFKTITAAALVSAMGDEVIIDEGIYREQVPIVSHGHEYLPALMNVFKAVPGKQVYLRGSDVFQADWEAAAEGLHKAKLPENLFKKDVYNPYEFGCVVDEPKKVRPVDGPKLPETLGQIYVHDKAFEQLDSVEAVRGQAESFAVSADGKEIIVHFAGDQIPEGKLIELTVRKHCFAPVFSGQLYIQTVGMVVEHAAEPGAFSLCRPLSIRANGRTGIIVRKTFAAPVNDPSVAITSAISYASKDKPTLIASLREPAPPLIPDAQYFNTVTSHDGGKTWEAVTDTRIACNNQSLHSYFLDEENGMLVRHYQQYEKLDLDGDTGQMQQNLMLQISADEGKTWGRPQRIDSGSVDYRIQKLQDGTLLWPYARNQNPGQGYDKMFAQFKTRLGRWREDISDIDWVEGGELSIDADASLQGLDEPHACQFPDGRIFVIFRQLGVVPGQNSSGFPTVKFFSVSEDNGKSFCTPKPLTYDDGRYIYSTASFPDAICSSKNGRVYVIINISERPVIDWDPRTTLHIMELDPDSLCVKRDTVAIIDARGQQHHYLVRFSNWSLLEGRDTKNLLLFMKLSVSQLCPVFKGYDYNSYRYEIQLPG